MRFLFMAAAILVTVLLSSWLFYINPPKDFDNISKFSYGLSGIQNYLKPGSSLNFKCKEPFAQQLLEARYVLFPVELHFDNSQLNDTTLLILPAKDTSFAFTGQKIWHNEDTNFSFTLITNFSMP